MICLSDNFTWNRSFVKRKFWKEEAGKVNHFSQERDRNPHKTWFQGMVSDPHWARTNLFFKISKLASDSRGDLWLEDEASLSPVGSWLKQIVWRGHSCRTCLLLWTNSYCGLLGLETSFLEKIYSRVTLLRRKPWSLRPWMNAWRVPYEARTSVVGYASEGSALRSMWRSQGLQPVGAPPPSSSRSCVESLSPFNLFFR